MNIFLGVLVIAGTLFISYMVPLVMVTSVPEARTVMNLTTAAFATVILFGASVGSPLQVILLYNACLIMSGLINACLLRAE